MNDVERGKSMGNTARSKSCRYRTWPIGAVRYRTDSASVTGYIARMPINIVMAMSISIH